MVQLKMTFKAVTGLHMFWAIATMQTIIVSSGDVRLTIHAVIISKISISKKVNFLLEHLPSIKRSIASFVQTAVL